MVENKGFYTIKDKDLKIFLSKICKHCYHKVQMEIPVLLVPIDAEKGLTDLNIYMKCCDYDPKEVIKK